MASKQYDFTLAAVVNASQRMDVRGAFCKLITATSPIVVKADTGEEWLLLPGQGFRFPTGKTFEAVTVRNVLAVANVGVIFIGDSLFEDSRITGDVSVVDVVNASSQIYIQSNTALGFNTAPLIAPGSNLRGIIVRQSAVEVAAGAGGTANARLIAAPAAPGSMLPTGVPAIILNTLFNGTTTAAGSYLFDTRRQIPPGWGLHYCSNHSVAVAGQSSITVSAEIL